MIRSMTGYGEASCQSGGVHYFLEIRSLNNRYYKAVIRLPEEFQGLEAEIDTELRHRLRRGSITVSATCTDASEQAAYTINQRALASYVAQLRDVPEIGAGSLRLELAPLLGLPGVLQPPVNESDRVDRARSAFLSLLARACEGVLAMRATEGTLLHTDLRSQAEVIEARLREVADRAPQVVLDYERRLKARIDLMLRDAELGVQPVDVVREIAVYAERADISEELTRLAGHLVQFRELLAGPDAAPVGRTMDFLTQEMLREANTIASKCADVVITRAIVEVKGAIDRIKEQVQNIE